MKSNLDTTLTIIDTIRKHLLKGVNPFTQLSEEAKNTSSLLACGVATETHTIGNGLMELMPFAERFQKVEEFVAATDAYIYYADCEENYGDYYVGATDTIHLSYPVDFLKGEDASQTAHYFRILFHELAHWTGNPHRLNRRHSNAPSSLSWAKEELTAELTAAFLLSEFGIAENSVTDGPAYLAKWLPIFDLLNDNKSSITTAMSQAKQAYDYLSSLQNNSFNR